MTFELISVEDAPLRVRLALSAIAARKHPAPPVSEATETSGREGVQQRKKKRRD